MRVSRYEQARVREFDASKTQDDKNNKGAIKQIILSKCKQRNVYTSYNPQHGRNFNEDLASAFNVQY